MKALSLVFRWVSLFTVLALVIDANAQPSTNPAESDDEEKAPEWLVWREFHQSLRFYEAQSPHAVSELLKTRAALAGIQKASFMASGDGYLERIVQIDSAARAGVLAQYKNRFLSPPPFATKPEELLRADAGSASRGLLPGTLADGRSLREVLEEDGFIDAVEEQKEKALQAHLLALRQSLGDETLSKLKGWIAVDVTPKVSVVEDRVPPAVPEGALPIVAAITRGNANVTPLTDPFGQRLARRFGVVD